MRIRFEIRARPDAVCTQATTERVESFAALQDLVSQSVERRGNVSTDEATFRTLSWDNVLPVFNLATGRIEDLPFDLRSRRPVTYTMTEEAGDKASELKKLARTLQEALILIIAGASKNPRLSLDAEIIGSRKQIILKIKNEGNGLARAPYLSFTIPENFDLAPYGIDGNGNHGYLEAPHGGSNHRRPGFGGKTDIVIHPHTTVDVARIVFRGRDNTYPPGDILIDYELRAEGAPRLNSSMTINDEGAIS